jgi:glycosyltransferase involved in cell wall biosynthesis
MPVFFSNQISPMMLCRSFRTEIRTYYYLGTNCSVKISIITVVFNGKKTIEDAIQSVASQTYRDIEHIVIDGGSVDGTLEILEGHRDKLAKVICEPDQGIYDAMNKGLRCATGDVIGLLNSDDQYAHPRVIDNVMKHLSVPGIEAVFADAAFIDPKRPKAILRRYSSRHFRPTRIPWGWMPAHPTLFLKREVYARCGLFKPDFKIAGDFEFVARAFWRTGIRYTYLPDVLVKMNTGGVSTSGWAGTMLLNREVLRACRENGIQTNMFKISSKYLLKMFEFVGPKV